MLPGRQKLWRQGQVVWRKEPLRVAQLDPSARFPPDLEPDHPGEILAQVDDLPARGRFGDGGGPERIELADRNPGVRLEPGGDFFRDVDRLPVGVVQSVAVPARISRRAS